MDSDVVNRQRRCACALNKHRGRRGVMPPYLAISQIHARPHPFCSVSPHPPKLVLLGKEGVACMSQSATSQQNPSTDAGGVNAKQLNGGRVEALRRARRRCTRHNPERALQRRIGPAPLVLTPSATALVSLVRHGRPPSQRRNTAERFCPPTIPRKRCCPRIHSLHPSPMEILLRGAFST